MKCSCTEKNEGDHLFISISYLQTLKKTHEKTFIPALPLSLHQQSIFSEESPPEDTTSQSGLQLNVYTDVFVDNENDLIIQ